MWSSLKVYIKIDKTKLNRINNKYLTSCCLHTELFNLLPWPANHSPQQIMYKYKSSKFLSKRCHQMKPAHAVIHRPWCCEQDDIANKISRDWSTSEYVFILLACIGSATDHWQHGRCNRTINGDLVSYLQRMSTSQTLRDLTWTWMLLTTIKTLNKVCEAIKNKWPGML